MTSVEIITELYESKELNQCLANLIPKQYRDDFRQELFLELLRKDKELIKRLHREKALIYYVVNIVVKYRNNGRWTVIPYANGHEFDPAAPEVEMGERLVKEQFEEWVIKEIEAFDNKFDSPYFRCLAEGIKQHGSLRELARQTGVDVNVLSRSLKKIREHFKQIE